MKKSLLITLIALLMPMLSNAQRSYIHDTNEGDCRQSYHSVRTSDGCIIIDEDIFDMGTQTDILSKNFHNNTFL